MKVNLKLLTPFLNRQTTKTVVHKADTRGDTNHGWLHSKHSFSFVNYYNHERIGFSALKVLFFQPLKSRQ